jgi:hypothetical protein
LELRPTLEPCDQALVGLEVDPLVALAMQEKVLALEAGSWIPLTEAPPWAEKLLELSYFDPILNYKQVGRPEGWESRAVGGFGSHLQ